MLHPHPTQPLIARLMQLEKQSAIIEYSLSGFFIVVADYAAFVICFNILQLGLLASTIIAYVVGFVVSYLLFRFWVFRKNGEHHTGRSMFRYTVLVVFNLFLTYLALWGMESAGITPLIGKFVVNFFMYFWIYAADKYWVFREPAQAR